ncbi:MAG: alpha/beta fold hydrolase [Alphaproteobacteria bacterium]|nr:alpha/beta fold hydrolase [Alphaproteobacteria bacterium]MDX5417401.1 alpha/beta fold hydrolase [Alphaproteobacteria bacterium]MDX5494872.1 alpha/beta fold hydrolase [Alphaproteobacteria bacterium]
MREDDPATPGDIVSSKADLTGEAPSSRIGEAVDAVYGYAVGRYNWEDLIDFLAHLDHDSESGLAGPEELVSSLGAHLRRADELATRLHEGSSDPGYALVLLDRQRRLIASNEGGREFFGAVCLPLVQGQRLVFADTGDDMTFAAALKDLDKKSAAPILARFSGMNGDGAVPYYLVRGDALSPAMLRAAEFDAGGLPFCALVAAPPDAGDETLDLFRKALGLTPAEARLAARLRFGQSLKEAAEELGISINTARNQLKSVFEKLGVNRQADLVRHLAELAALATSMQVAQSGSRGTVTVAERRIIALPDCRHIALREFGRPDGFPVFILHPLVQSSLMRPQEARIAGKCGVRLISVERPGIGMSTLHPAGNYVSFSADLAAVADALGIGRFAILGWASGAPYALTAASVLGDRVTRLALATPRLGFRSDLEPTTQARRFFGGLRRHPWLFEAVFSIMRSKRSRRFFRPMIRNFLETSEPDRLLFENDTTLLSCLTDSLVEAIDITHKGIVAELNFYSKDIPPEISGIARPILVWHGAEDEMNSAEDVERMLKGVSVDEFHVEKGQGHMVLFGHFRDILVRLVNDGH